MGAFVVRPMQLSFFQSQVGVLKRVQGAFVCSLPNLLAFLRPFLFVSMTLLQLAAIEARAANIQLNWNRNSEPSVVGYRVKIGTVSHSYRDISDVGNNLSFSFTGAVAGQSYFFVIVAYTAEGLESDPSGEAQVNVPGPTPPNDPGPDTDGDGTPDSSDLDDDNDGLTDADEAVWHTNSLIADTDGDGISDGEEVRNGSDPLAREADPSSTMCGEWNGFLGGMWNIAEMINLSNRVLNATVVLYNQLGQAVNERHYALAPGQQYDALVHDFSGRVLNSYGNVCISYNGAPGELDGRMVYYKLGSITSRKLGEEYDFALAMPFSGGKKGSQFVLFDTFQRSANAKDAANAVANWIQVSNLGAAPSSGVLRFYASTGALLGEDALNLAPGQRLDVPAHRFGAGHIGVVEWSPTDNSQPFLVRNMHYLYDNPYGWDSFSGAFQQEGTAASGENLVVPLDTEGKETLLQVTNTLSNSVNATVSVINSVGTVLLAPANIVLGPKATWVASLRTQIPNQKAYALIKGALPNSLVGGVIQYSLNAQKNVGYMYLVPAQPSGGVVLRGSYNTFLSQRSELWITNTSAGTQLASVQVVRSDGFSPMAPLQLILPPHGMYMLPISDHDAYGVITLQGQINDSLVAWVQRVRTDYVMPTPVRE